MLGVVLLFGLPDLPEPAAGDRTAAVVQPNLAGEKQWTAPDATAMQQRLELLTLQTALDRSATKPSFALWPEVPAPVYYYDDAPFRERMHTLARVANLPILIGTVAANERGAPLNSALLIGPAGQALGRYDKMFLVPFGEYIPFPFGGLVQKVTQEVGDFVPGQRVVIFDAGPQRIGAFICYESAFPHLVRRFTAAGAGVLVNLSNDGYFGGSAAREQHLSLVRMRAAENSRWILRATNDGITAAIDPAGRVRARFEQFREIAGRLEYRYEQRLTPYARYGDVFAWSCTLLAAAGLLLSQRPTRDE